jgi:alkylation response protein AidB-like acyl-CoA dehydrogenase
MGTATVSLVEAARGVAKVVESHADDAERLRRLPAPVVAALTEAGLMRMCVPAVYGGPEADPMELVMAIEAVAHADGAAGWCSMIASTTSSLAAFLPAATAQMI